MAMLLKINKLQSVLEKFLAYTSAAIIFLMMANISADAAGRYIFNYPILFTYELVEKYLLPASLLLILSNAYQRGSHVNVSVFVDMMPWRFEKGFSAVVTAASAVLVSYIFWIGLRKTMSAFSDNEYSVGYYYWPVWVSEVIVPIGFGLLAVRLVLASLGLTVEFVLNRTETQFGAGES
ncbi:MAG: TRAP transporter small permease [Roseovarius sp.]